MPDSKKTFMDYQKRQWSIELTLAFWDWYARTDLSQINLSGIIYIAMRDDFNVKNISPRQSVLITACPQAVKAFYHAIREWLNG